jgi:hypothetical protein
LVFFSYFLLVGFVLTLLLSSNDDYSAAATARASHRQDVGAVQAGTEAVAPDPQERKETVMSSVTVWQALFSAVLCPRKTSWESGEGFLGIKRNGS